MSEPTHQDLNKLRDLIANLEAGLAGAPAFVARNDLVVLVSLAKVALECASEHVPFDDCAEYGCPCASYVAATIKGGPPT